MAINGNHPLFLAQVREHNVSTSEKGKTDVQIMQIIILEETNPFDLGFC